MSMVLSFGARCAASLSCSSGSCGVWCIKQIFGDGMVEVMVVVGRSTALPLLVKSTLFEVILFKVLLKDRWKM